jgi:hypothetical protein
MMWLRRSTGRKHAQVNFAEFVFTVEDMGCLTISMVSLKMQEWYVWMFAMDELN